MRSEEFLFPSSCLRPEPRCEGSRAASWASQVCESITSGVSSKPNSPGMSDTLKDLDPFSRRCCKYQMITPMKEKLCDFCRTVFPASLVSSSSVTLPVLPFRFSVYCNTALNWLRSTTWAPFLLPTQITALLAGGRCTLASATRVWTAWQKSSRFKLCVHVITDWVHCWQYPGHVAPHMLIDWTWHQNLHLTCAAHIMHLRQDFQAPKGSPGTLADFLMPPMDLPGATIFICHT